MIALPPVSSSPRLEYDAKRHWRNALGQETSIAFELHPQLPLVVGYATRIEPLPTHLGRERIALPQLERRRRAAHAVVAVDEER